MPEIKLGKRLSLTELNEYFPDSQAAHYRFVTTTWPDRKSIRLTDALRTEAGRTTRERFTRESECLDTLIRVAGWSMGENTLRLIGRDNSTLRFVKTTTPRTDQTEAPERRESTESKKPPPSPGWDFIPPGDSQHESSIRNHLRHIRRRRNARPRMAGELPAGQAQRAKNRSKANHPRANHGTQSSRTGREMIRGNKPPVTPRTPLLQAPRAYGPLPGISERPSQGDSSGTPRHRQLAPPQEDERPIRDQDIPARRSPLKRIVTPRQKPATLPTPL